MGGYYGIFCTEVLEMVCYDSLNKFVNKIFQCHWPLGFQEIYW